MKIETSDMELAIVSYFRPRVNLVIPNVSWGMFDYECDLIVMTKARYLYEVEIKVSLSDLKKDIKKKHGHKNNKIKYLYFAIPHYLERHKNYVPERAGIIIVRERDDEFYVDVIRKPEVNVRYEVTEEERYKLARLGALRIWDLKRKLIEKDKK